MIAETTINLYPIFRFIFYLGIFSTIIILCYFVKECFFKTKDTSITTNLLDKYPNVSEFFMKKTLKEQNIENNQEIHEINKRLDSSDKEICDIKESLAYITKILEEMQKKNG